jgi:hypothetical protein
VPTNVLVDSDDTVGTIGAGNPDELYAAVEALLSG